MAGRRKERRKPCKRCKERHLRCDDKLPCSHCTKLGVDCSPVTKGQRFQIRTNTKFRFAAEQPWVSSDQALFSASAEPARIKEAADSRARPSAPEATDESRHAHPPPPNRAGDRRVEASPVHRRRPSPAGGSARDDAVAALPGTSEVTVEHGDRSASSPASQLERQDPDTPRVNDFAIGTPSSSGPFCPAGSSGAHARDISPPPPLAEQTHRDWRTALPANVSIGLQEACLIRCFIKNLATAFDTTDREQTYSLEVPRRARHSSILLNAVCTASATYLIKLWSDKHPRQRIMVDDIPLPELTRESAIHYHNSCIAFLMSISRDQGEFYDENVLLAIPILRYHEQVDSHLTGQDTETYSKAVQAIFRTRLSRSIGFLGVIDSNDSRSCTRSAALIALRQEIWSALRTRRKFILPLSTFEFSQIDVCQLQDEWAWTNAAIVWCACVLKLCFGDDDQSTIDTSSSRADTWNTLAGFEVDWNAKKPASFAPLHYEASCPGQGRYFPTIWQMNHCQVIGLQHMEVGRMMLAAHDPSHPRIGLGVTSAARTLESRLRASLRTICGLALSHSTCQPIMVSATAAVSLAAEYVRDPREQTEILGFLSRVERDFAMPMGDMRDTLRKNWADS